jgi:hypothetical protein
MAGRRHKCFRSGDLNEELGILLLKGVAAVATVARPEDIGIDAIATLLREADDNLLFAENSFYVQLKSAYETTVKYQGHEVRWLEGLKLPFFIGSVDKRGTSLTLYAAHRLSQALIENSWEEIELVLNPENHVAFGFNAATEEVGTKTRKVDIGPPLLRWAVEDLSNPERMRQLYACLKPYLDAEQKNIDFRPVRYYQSISWKTGEVPVCKGPSCLSLGFGSDEIVNLLRGLQPYIIALDSKTWRENKREDFETVLRLVRYMRESGYDPDPHRHMEMRYEHWEHLQRGGSVQWSIATDEPE